MAVRRAPLSAPTLTTKEEWQRFVAAEPLSLPRRLTRKEYDALAADRQRRYDHARNRYHHGFSPVHTPQMQGVFRHLLDQVETNLGSGEPGPRPGSVLDGAAGVGKSTMLRHFGRAVHIARCNEYPDPLTEAGGEHVPVVHVTVNAGETPKGLNMSIARFLGVPNPYRLTTKELTSTIEELAHRSSTVLFLVDEVHFLNLRYRTDQDVNNHLKHLANVIPATFVYAGTDTETSGLFGEGRPKTRQAFSQTRRRFHMLPIAPFTIDTPAGRKAWRELLTSLEDHFLLLDTAPGFLAAALDEYLHARTGGNIGSLLQLLRTGAADAIDKGRARKPEERLTEKLLDRVTIDYAAEQAAGRTAPRQRRSRTAQDVGAILGLREEALR